MKKISCLIPLLLFIGNTLVAQVGINSDNSAPDPSAGLDVKFIDKGVLPPRMTAGQRDAIAGPAEGLMVFCTDCGANGSLSQFSNGEWRTFTPCNTPSTSSASNTVSPGQITWKWTAVSGASGYKWNTINTYGSATDMGTATSKTETGLSCNTTYNRYVWAYNVCGISVPLALSQIVSATAPASPVSGTHVPALFTIVWNWTAVPDAIGYKWNTTNNYGTAIDIGIAITKTESGLNCGVSYSRYLWAYNGCGYSSPVTLTQSTWPCGTCGSLTITHSAGTVAPVTKTTTYATVVNLPGETGKCWIANNLGSNHQAIGESDTTEASAGWYWQFNRKQGFKHNGLTRTPNTTWILNITENSDWSAGNDPCVIELSNGWRIPTKTEWTDVDGVGNWTNWEGSWAYGLNLHASGYLDENNGSLINRGIRGDFWSNTQSEPQFGWYLSIGQGDSEVINSNNKGRGHSLRCIRNIN